MAKGINNSTHCAAFVLALSALNGTADLYVEGRPCTGVWIREHNSERS